jgi:hypothetical protein
MPKRTAHTLFFLVCCAQGMRLTLNLPGNSSKLGPYAVIDKGHAYVSNELFFILKAFSPNVSPGVFSPSSEAPASDPHLSPALEGPSIHT